MSLRNRSTDYLTGQLLIAMPHLVEQPFERTVIYMCHHNEDGAMGIVLNKLLGSVTFPELLEHLGIDAPQPESEISIHFGGPVETGRGFVLHSSDYVRDGTSLVDDDLALTATIDIVQAIADGGGPRQSLLALGYAGWGPGQLDSEIQANGWLSVPADETLVFGDNLDTTWERSLLKIGVDPTALSGAAGRA